MSSDGVAPLRELLRKIDGTAPQIQGCAGAMMKLYNRASGVAVVEWRNALQQARPDQLVPLLYVANEVLQTSKRNRGNNFLEAFSPILGQSLRFIAEQHSATPSIVEKVRRTVKIWGDRRVFSVRFVNELLQGLRQYRDEASNGRAVQRRQEQHLASPEASGFSPIAPTATPEPAPESPAVVPQSNATSTSPAIDIDAEMKSFSFGRVQNEDVSLHDDNRNSGAGIEDDSDDDDDDDLFGSSGDGIKLDIKVDLERHADALASPSKGEDEASKKRRRSIGSTGSSSSHPKRSRRSSILSTTSLTQLWSQVESLQKGYDHAQAVLSGIAPNGKLREGEGSGIEMLVGDELRKSHDEVVLMERTLETQRRELHRIAHQRRTLEQECLRYLPWLEHTLKQDVDDIKFCDKVDLQLRVLKPLHAAAREARDKRRAEELKKLQQDEERKRKAKEEEERRKFMESAMRKETEAKPGMVWNKATGEYQYLHTDESWRD